MIHINYRALEQLESSKARVNVDLLKKARGFFGRAARQEILELFRSEMRVMAAEIARREVNPQDIYKAGVEGLWEALETYDLETCQPSFREYAFPFIRQHMIHAKKKRV